MVYPGKIRPVLRILRGIPCILLLLFGSLTVAEAQKPVTDPAFQERLESLLAHSVDETSVPEATAREGTVFLDARSAEEYAVSHIPGSLWIGYEDFSPARVAALSRDLDVVVYCSVGYRSEKIAEKLKEAGFSRVSNLYGGIFEWVNQGHPLEDREGKTNRVHAFNRNWGRWLRRGDPVY